MKPVMNLNIIKLMSEKMNKRRSFEVSPLDINLAKLQFNLIDRLEREVPQYGDFAPVIEKYTSKNPKLKIGDIVIKCIHSSKSENKTERILDLTIFDKYNPEKSVKHSIVVGSKDVVLEKIKQQDFFETCKNFILEFDKQLG